jgi:hypothetical protein
MPITSPMYSAANVDTIATAYAADNQTHPAFERAHSGLLRSPRALFTVRGLTSR